MIFKKLLSVVVLTSLLITGSSFKLNNYRAKARAVNQVVIKDTTTREKILHETGIHLPSKMPKEHIKTMYNEAKKRNIPIRILVKVIQKESKFKSDAINKNSGAIGYMQLMPSTYSLYARKMNLKKSPNNNIKVGTYYLKEMYNIWDREGYTEDRKWRLALASYNAGIDNVIKIKRVPNITETKNFVQFILE